MLGAATAEEGAGTKSFTISTAAKLDGPHKLTATSGGIDVAPSWISAAPIVSFRTRASRRTMYCYRFKTDPQARDSRNVPPGRRVPDTVTRLAFLGAILAGVLLVAPTSTANDGTRCTTRNERVVKLNPRVAVVARRRSSLSDVPKYHVCDRSSGRRRFIGTFPPHEGPQRTPENFVIAGRLVGYEEVLVHTERRANDFRLVIRDVARDRVVRRLRPYERTASGDPLSVSRGITDLELTALGRAAWIIRNPYAPIETIEVYRLRAGTIERLDAGEGIKPGSLTRSGCRILWEHGGQTRASELC